ncbi:MAG: hypothetical protein OER82_11395 [Nitrosopumilus sp.]|nr:hypothetical protein [Nitrosopumilus sp.]
MDNLQIENTINENRKRSGAVTAFNKDKISRGKCFVKIMTHGLGFSHDRFGDES